VSAKLMKLQSLFGETAELDVAAMLIKEPRLAITDIKLIARRLLEMRVSLLKSYDDAPMYEIQRI